MMTNPLGELKDSLEYLFVLQRIKKTDNYLSPSVQHLKLSLDNFQSDSSKSLNALIYAIKEALPVIENYVDSYMVKQKMEILAGTMGKNVNWRTN